MISIKSLNKYFNRGSQNEIHVINNVSLDLPEKGMVAVFGKSGCGKTTLLNVIGGLDNFKSGTVTVEGNNISNNPDDIRNKYIGYIFQNYNLLSSQTCFENVASALKLCGVTDKEQIEERAMAALKNVGMEKYYKRTPDTLSGGQQQRIAIARAIVKNPRIILADEPTGNLDEANTIVIMDLLKQIAKEHLVILVTHEANLVDYYCNTVIELNDGQIVNIRNNDSADGYSTKDKNDIYLGELKKRTMSSQKANVEYYGDLPEEPVKLRIVNNGGKMYIQINSSNVQILDASSEVKLHDGVYDQVKKARAASAEINMEKLPPVQAEKCGRLFSFSSAFKSGYAINFKGRKIGKKILLACMGLFAAVFVFVCSFCGKYIGEYIAYEDSYDHYTFYIQADDKISDKINNVVGSEESGIDYVSIHGRYIRNWYNGCESASVLTASFETYDVRSFYVDTIIMDESICSDMQLLEGKNTGLEYYDVVVTTAFADKIMANDATKLIKNYKDVLGVTILGGSKMRIVGVVRSDERAAFVPVMRMADMAIANTDIDITLGSSQNVDVAEGQIEIVKRYAYTNSKLPDVGEELLVNGLKLTVGKVTDLSGGYFGWLKEKGIIKQDYEVFMTNGFLSENPDLSEPAEGEYDQDYYDRYYEYKDEHYFEWWDYCYDGLDDYMLDSYRYSPTMYNWMYSQYNIKETKFTEVKDSASYYYGAKQYEKEFGKLPTLSEFKKWDEDNNFYYASSPVDWILSKEIKDYEELSYQFKMLNLNSGNGNQFLVSDSDYIKISKRSGTSSSILRHDIYYSDAVQINTVRENLYLMVHSVNPERTEAFLKSTGGSLYTPNYFREQIIGDNMVGIIVGLSVFAFVVAMLSVCMYFIMRSSLMSRIKEVGIYRAIGVSKRNMIFKFLVESLVLIMFTVLIGYIIASMFVFNLGGASILSSAFFYPVWYAGIVLVLLLGICTLCGVLPVMTLLNNTPSQILSKYDI